MKSTWRRFMDPLTPGSRMMLFALTIAYVVAVFGIFSHAYDLYPVLAVAGPGFWKGKIWTVVTYALLPATLVDFLFNWIMIMVLGWWLERAWSRRQLWAFSLFSALGAGVAKVVLEPANPLLMAGTSPVVFGLLAAWGYLFAYERIMFWFVWDMTIRQAAIILTVVSALMMLPCAGLRMVAIMLCGGLAGVAWLWVESKVLRSRPSQQAVSERMGRLEI